MSKGTAQHGSFLTCSEVAKRWGMSTRQIQRLCATNELPSIRPGLRRRLIPEAAVIAREQEGKEV